MIRLILIRHAQAVWGRPGLKDFDRPLDDRGRKEARLMGARLAARSTLPDTILSSPAARARETGETIASEIGFPEEKIAWDPAIYDAETRDLLQVIHGLAPAWQSVFLIGHNPGVTDLANLLAGAGLSNLPTCSVVGIEFPDENVNHWTEVDIDSGRVFYYDYPWTSGE